MSYPADRTYRDVPWVAVQPEHPDNVEAGWTVWTRGLEHNHRIAWIGNLPESELIARYIAVCHNEIIRKSLEAELAWLEAMLEKTDGEP